MKQIYHTTTLFFLFFILSTIHLKAQNCNNPTSINIDANQSACTLSSGSTVGASSDFAEMDCSVSTVSNVWFLPNAGTYDGLTIEITNYSGSGGIGVALFSVLGQTCSEAITEGGFSQIACNYSPSGGTVTLVINECITINNGSFGLLNDQFTVWTEGGEGSFDLCIYENTYGASTNDECTTAATLTLYSNETSCIATTGTLNGATTSADTVSCGTIARDVWFTFSTSTTVTDGIVIDGYDNMALYDGCGGAELDCIAGGSTLIYDNTLPAGDYYIRVWGANGSCTGSSFDICVYESSQPLPNDDCSSAQALNVNTAGTCSSNFVSGTTTGALQDPSPDFCSNGDVFGVWYSFQAPAGGSVNINLNSLNGSVHKGILYDDCEGNILNCLPNFPIHIGNLNPSNTYYIFVYSGANDQGDFEICLGGPPANDDCSEAIEIIPSAQGGCSSGAITGTTINASHDGSVSCDFYSSCSSPTGTGCNNGVWYRFTAASTEVEIFLENTNTMSTDPLEMAVFDGCGGSEIDCALNVDESRTVSGLTIGQEYFVLVWFEVGFNVYSGPFSICIEEPLQNDDCSNAVSLPVETNGDCIATFGSNDGATDSGVGTPTCGFYLGEDVWYSVIVPATGSLTVEMSFTSGGFSDGEMAIYSGSCGALTEIACDENSGINSMPKIELTGQTPSDVLYVRVWGRGFNRIGPFSICAFDEPNCTPPTLSFYFGQCQNGQFATTFVLDAKGTATTVNATTSLGETINDIQVGVSYGLNPVDFSTNFDLTILDADNPSCQNTYIVFPNEQDPSLSYLVLADCDNDQFSILATVDDFCGNTSINLSDDQGVSSFTNITEGQNYILGPYTSGTLVEITASSSTRSTIISDITASCVPLPPNDLCTDAIVVTCGNSYLGSTINATGGNLPNGGGTAACGGDTPDAAGLWYSFVGTGEEITLDLCENNGLATNYDADISVFTGDCSGLVCLNGLDGVSSCSWQPTLTFQSQLGTNYLIYVNGYESDVGDFEMNVSCPLPNPCPNPSEFVVVEVTAETAQLEWNSGGSCTVGAEYWVVPFSFSNPPSEPVPGTGNSINCTNLYEFSVTNLDHATEHLVYAMEYCDNGDQSDVHPIGFFTTQPINNNVCDAIDLTTIIDNGPQSNITVNGTNYPFSNLGSDTERDEPTPDGGSCFSQNSWCTSMTRGSVWFSFTAPTSGNIDIAVAGTFFMNDLKIALWEENICGTNGINPNAIMVAANDDFSASDSNPRINDGQCLIPGRTYYIQVAGTEPFNLGTFDITMSDPGTTCPVAPMGLNCGTTAMAISTGMGEWIHLYQSGQVVASINDIGNDLGNINVEVNTTSTTRTFPNGLPYLNRNWEITVDNNLPALVRFYLTPAELAALNIPGDNTQQLQALNLTKVAGGVCEDYQSGGEVLPNINYQLIFDGTNHMIQFGINGFSAFYLNAGLGPLPVELTGFTATAKEKQVLLNWQTASETNNKGFYIARSIDGRQWDKIGFVDGKGESTTLQYYQFVDAQPLIGLNYYRLIQEDFDGQTSYSEIKIVNFSHKSDSKFQVYPNPNQGSFLLSSNQMSDGEPLIISIFSPLGKLVLQQEVNLENSPYQVKLPAIIENGVYFLRIQQADQSYFETRVIVLRN